MTNIGILGATLFAVSGCNSKMTFVVLPSVTVAGSKAVIRVGELTQNNNQDKYKTINWSDIPPGNELNVRMSGLVWPEASVRIANSCLQLELTFDCRYY